MKKQPKEQEEIRQPGPKFERPSNSPIPTSFQIRRTPSPMEHILNEAAGLHPATAPTSVPQEVKTQEKITPVKSTPVKNTRVEKQVGAEKLPKLEVFIDDVLPHFPPAQQLILLRLYRWCEGVEKEFVVSTPRLARQVNVEERTVRNHLQALTSDGFIERQQDGMHIARFGGNDRNQRGLILKLSAKAFSDLIK